MENNGNKCAVTGAFGYTGKYITRRLLAQGKEVITLTGQPGRANEFSGKVQAFPFRFDRITEMAQSLQDVHTLYNTYWVRFDHGSATYERAVANTQALFEAAKLAGVKRIVHVSISNPSLDSPLPYFKGKAVLEKALIETGLGYAIVRPTVVFGREDILINNIAYLLRRFPVFAIPGSGKYLLQPIFVEDMAALCVEAGEKQENLRVDAVGPDILSFNELVALIKTKIGSRAILLHAPERLTLWLSQVIGTWVKDVVLTRDEIDGLSANLLVSDGKPTGATHLSDWLKANAASVGVQYASELGRHYRANGR
jgi:NADH dehydrogenase